MDIGDNRQHRPRKHSSASKRSHKSSKSHGHHGHHHHHHNEGPGISEEERKELALRQAEDVLWQIPRSLHGIKQSDFNPVALALQMMDSSSLGKSYDEFCYYYKMLNESLNGIVNEYYGGFNNSILTFSGLHDRIQDASGSVSHVKNNLQKVRRMILEERGSLDQLYTKSNQLGSIVSILDRLEEVKKLPDELGTYAENKKFLTAASKLVEDMRYVFDPELNPIEALSGLRLQLEKEKSGLLSQIINELHNHIYLKSPYCERKMGIEGEDGEDDENNGVDGVAASQPGNDNANNEGNSSTTKRQQRQRLGKGSSRKTKPKTAAIDSSDENNPEADSFAYVEMLLESLATLDNTNEAMQEIKSSSGLELSRLIDGIISEVEDRNKALIVKTKFSDNPDDMLAQDIDREILYDFSRILFARLETVLEYHEYVLDIVGSLDRRERYSLSPQGGSGGSFGMDLRRRRTQPYMIGDIWGTIKEEVLSILKDYLIPEEAAVIDGANDSSSNSSLKPSIKDLFHLEKNAEISDEVGQLYSQIERHFQDVAVTVAKKKKNTGTPAVIDEYADHQNSLKHKLLVDPNIEHAPILLNMALTFTKRIVTLLGSSLEVPHDMAQSSSARRSIAAGDKSTSSYLSTSLSTGQQQPQTMLSPSAGNDQDLADEYLQTFFKKVFLTKADAYATQLFDGVISASDAFDVDPTTYFRGRPIFRGAAAIVPLLQNFGSLLNDLNQFKGENWSILLQLSGKYYDKCWELFKTTTRTPDGQTYTSVKWSETPELLQLFTQKQMAVGNDKSQRPLSSQMLAMSMSEIDKEIRLEEKLKTERSLHLNELMFDVKRLVCLAQLHQTLEWLLVQLDKIAADRAKVLSKYEAAIAAALLKRHEADKAKVVGKYRSLSTQCLMVLRIEVRAHCTYYLDLATREGSYSLDEDTMEPDQYVQALNADISTIEEKMESCLPADRLNLVFGGISVLMAHILVANTRYIRRFNEAGNHKMIRNILALQQNLTNIALPEESGLDMARRFFEMYEMGADEVLKNIAEHGAKFSFDNYRQLLDFMYSKQQQGGRANNLEEAKQGEQYDKHIRRLRELLSQQ